MAKRKNSASAGPNLPATATSDPRDKKTAQTVEETERVRKFLALAGERFKEAKDAESVYRKDCLDDLKFSIGGKNQWPATIRAQREDDGRPCLTMNRSGQFVNQVTNSQREQRPSVNVNPAGDGATVETAEILQGIIRHIELRSEAEVAYDTA